MQHFIYKTTNKINGKYYFGAHSTNKIDDKYLGSGKLLEKAIKKYGKDNFSREIICFCENVDDLYAIEKEIISEHLDNELCYNINSGGKGGWYAVNASNMHRGDNNVMRRCPEIKNKVTESAKKTRAKNKEFYDRISRENIKKAKGVVRRSPKGMSEIVKKYWAENYDKQRDALSSNFEVISPDGVIFNTNRLMEFCDVHNLTYTSLWNTSRTNKPVKKGKAKGWMCKKISQL